MFLIWCIYCFLNCTKTILSKLEIIYLMYCRICGAKIDDNNTVCPKCGASVEVKSSKKSTSIKSKILPFIVCCVLAMIVFGAILSYFGDNNKSPIDNSVPNKTLNSSMISEFMNNSTSDSSRYIPVESDDSANDSANKHTPQARASGEFSGYSDNSHSKKFHYPY